jgi:hypothetical protein
MPVARFPWDRRRATVKMLGRWHGMNGQGFAISESTDAKALFQWVAQWSDLLQLWVAATVPHGATFQFTLPVNADTAS